MTKLEREIHIDAPPEEVYDTLMDPDALGKWVTIQQSLEEARVRYSLEATVNGYQYLYDRARGLPPGNGYACPTESSSRRGMAHPRPIR